MKKFSAVLFALCFVIVSCGGKHSPTAPSSNDAQTKAPDLTQKIYVQFGSIAAGQVYVNLYGMLGWGLDSSLRSRDLNGAMLRVRVYDGAKFKTWTTSVYNSAPIGGTNDTIVRDIPVNGSIDFTFTLEPYDCASNGGAPKCWLLLTFPESSRYEFLPSQKGYKLENRNGEVHVTGPMPAVQTMQ